MTSKSKIEQSLSNHGLRDFVGAIESNPGTPGEVVLWIDGAGVPVYSIRQAVQVVRDHAEQ